METFKDFEISIKYCDEGTWEGVVVYFHYDIYKIIWLFMWNHMSFVDICSDF